MYPPPEVFSRTPRAVDQASDDSFSAESSNGRMSRPRVYATQGEELELSLMFGSASQYPAPPYPHAAPQYPVPQNPAPQHSALQHPAPQHPAPQHPAPQHPAPQHPAQQYPAQQYPAPQYPAQQYPAPQYPAQQYPAQQYPAPQYAVPQQYPLPQYPVLPYPIYQHTEPYFMTPQPEHHVIPAPFVEGPPVQWTQPDFTSPFGGHPYPATYVSAPMDFPQQQMFPQMVYAPNNSIAPHVPAPTNPGYNPPVVNTPQAHVKILTHESSQFCKLGKYKLRPGAPNDTGPPMTSEGFFISIRLDGAFDKTGRQPGLFLSKTKNFALLVVQNVFVHGSRKVEVWGPGGQYHLYDVVGVLGDDNGWLLGDKEIMQKGTGTGAYSGIAEGIQEGKRRVKMAPVTYRSQRGGC